MATSSVVIPPAQCVRIATNQIGSSPQEPLPDYPGSGVWTGAQSGATGTHQQYVYEEVSPGPPQIVQQYIVMSAETGNFIDGEVLNHTP